MVGTLYKSVYNKQSTELNVAISNIVNLPAANSPSCLVTKFDMKYILDLILVN